MKKTLCIILIFLMATISFGCKPKTNSAHEKEDYFCTVVDSEDGHLILNYNDELAIVYCDNYGEFNKYDSVVVCGVILELDSDLTYQGNHISYEFTDVSIKLVPTK